MSSPPETAPIGAAGRDPSDVGDPGAAAPPRSGLLWSALLIVYVVWGSTYLAIRVSVETLPSFSSAALRFLVAGLILAVFIAVRRGPQALNVSGRQLAACALIGLLLPAGGNGAVVYAETGPPGRAVPSGVAALLIAGVPLIVVLLRVATGDRPQLATVVGVLVGFGGLAALILSRGGGGAVPLGGALLVVAAAVSWASGSFFARKVPLPADPLVATAYESLVGGAALAAMALFRGERLAVADVSARSWFALGYLVVAGSLIAFTAYVWLLQHAPISLTATYAYVNPAVAVALGALLVAEPVTPVILVSGAVIIAGVALVVSTERPRRTRERPRAG